MEMLSTMNDTERKDGETIPNNKGFIIQDESDFGDFIKNSKTPIFHCPTKDQEEEKVGMDINIDGVFEDFDL